MQCYGQVDVRQNGLDLAFSAEEEWDFVRCLAGFGTQEFQLPCAEERLGRRYTFRRFGEQDVQINAASGETVEGSPFTYHMNTSNVTLQAVSLDDGKYGWEIVVG